MSGSIAGYVPISQFGAKSDGVTDDTVAIQATINYLENNGGGNAMIPPGIIVCNGVTISSGGVGLQGVGWEEYLGYQGEYSPGRPGTHGSRILTTSKAASTITFNNASGHAFIRDIAFLQNQPADAPGWTPTVYPPTIDCQGGKTGVNPGGAALLERLFCWNCYEFIQVGTQGNPASRITMKHIWGMPLSFGINIQFSSDVNRIDDVHFWPFMQNAPNVSKWIQNNGTALYFGRSDNFVANSVFAFGYYSGIILGSTSDGSSQNFSMTNIGLDSVVNGLTISAASGACTGHITNMYAQSAAGIPSGYGIVSTSPSGIGVFIDIVNFTSTFAGYNAVAISNNVDISIVNTFINYWNQANNGSPAFVSNAPAVIVLGGRLRLGGANGAATSAGNVLLSHVN